MFVQEAATTRTILHADYLDVVFSGITTTGFVYSVPRIWLL